MKPGIDKIIRPGTVKVGRRTVDLYCRIYYGQSNGKWRLSITGVEGPLRNGDCVGGCGQVNLRESYVSPANGWDADKIERFLFLWDRWHLNDCRAGTPKQEEMIRQWKESGWKYYYAEACERLDAAGMLTDEGYKYGSRWLYEEVPDEVLEFLRSLPATDKTPAWI